MNNYKYIGWGLAGLLIIIGIIVFSNRSSDSRLSNQPLNNQASDSPQTEADVNRMEFAGFNPKFRFSAEISEDLAVEYVPEIESLNLYEKDGDGDLRERSRIFIRYFEASQFLTLTTVDILQRNETEIHGHAAVEYEIRKKPGVANFPSQPSWRNEQHKLTDIRFSQNSPTTFYVFAHNPEYSENEFENFLDSLAFHNDQAGLKQPIDRANERVTKKPFGLYVEPGNSPVSPEKFTGFHNAVDYEILPGEENTDVAVYAICGGSLRQKRSTSGYGGLIIQDCEIEGQNVTILYGHVRLSSVTKNPGNYILPGEQIAVLGNGFSTETDDERKHLHLGIRKGVSTDIAGYVSTQSELNNWLDFRTYQPN
ncbi:MAG: M23 family metallopeptidase [Candidatus Doudnabacteria bacterium]|nr:M23 family metallopeptidase [Candidatus Doudnabacteria bacterium]